MRIRWQSVLLVLVVLVLGACSAHKRAPEPAGMTVTAGEEFDIRLPADPGTGFRWQVGGLNDKIVRLVDTRYEPSDPQPGAGGTDIFTFVGVSKGRSVVKLVYVRPWEKGVAPARTAVYSVDVL